MRVFTLLLLSGAVWAGDDASAKAKDTIAKLDADKDGKIAKSEFIGSESIFDRWDQNKDGFVTEAELTAGFAAPKPQPAANDRVETDRAGGKKGKGKRGRRGAVDPKRIEKQVAGTLKRFDKNGDGKIGSDELPERGAKGWLRMDANQDGFIDSAEMTVAFTERAQRRGAQGRDGMNRRGGGRDWAKRIQTMDADKDGKVAKAEWKGRPEGFDRLDQNKDGFIDAAEVEQFSKNMRRRGGWRNQPSEALFRRMDADKDQKISRDEWKMSPDMFDRFDANGDGFITTDEVMPKGDREMRVPNGNRGDALMRRFDKNGDGQIDAAEMGDGRRLAQMDRDGDGVITRAEIDQAMDRREREESIDFVARFDRDADGKVSREEFTGPARLFDKLDQNADGYVDAEESAKMKGKKRGKGGKKKNKKQPE
ncbi:MAG: EF-hand domain-containing protein [Planctomycetota bacterium]